MLDLINALPPLTYVSVTALDIVNVLPLTPVIGTYDAWLKDTGFTPVILTTSPIIAVKTVSATVYVTEVPLLE